MRTDMEALELKIQQLEEENLQLKGELDERPTLEDKQADEEYIDELRDLCAKHKRPSSKTYARRWPV